MPMIEIACPACQGRLDAREGGARRRCPACGSLVEAITDLGREMRVARLDRDWERLRRRLVWIGKGGREIRPTVAGAVASGSGMLLAAAAMATVLAVASVRYEVREVSDVVLGWTFAGLSALTAALGGWVLVARTVGAVRFAALERRYLHRRRQLLR